MLQYFEAINCFTDASLVTLPSGKNAIAAGYIITYNREVIDQRVKIIVDATSNYGEALAMYMGIDSLVRFSRYQLPMNLFSDSKLSVYGVTKWIFGWMDKVQTYTRKLINSSGDPVVNQELFIAIVWTVVSAGAYINIWHQRGHQNMNSIKDMRTFLKSFRKENNLDIPEDIARELIYFNQVIDNLTRDTLKTIVSNPNFRELDYQKPKVVFRPIISPESLKTYKQLIGGACNE